MEQLKRFPETFEVVGTGPSGRISFVPTVCNTDKRSAAVAKVLEVLRQEGFITGWRNELYPVVAAFYDEPLFLVVRGESKGGSCAR